MMNMFTSIFSEKLDAMLDYRVTCGLKRETYISHLVKFDKYCTGQKFDVPDLTADVVYGWLEDEVVRDVPGKAMAIRQFGKYLCAVGEDAYVLPKKFSRGRKTNPPYIFTDDELTALFAAIDKLASTKNEPHFSEIAPVLFRLTYTCGLRPNESRELLCKNANLESGEILITNTKKNKERIVVMSDDMRRLCCRYDLQRSIFGGQNPHFFPSSGGGALASSVVYAAFNKAWKEAVYTLGSHWGKTVRVYDLRHRFASACLIRWLDAGENLSVMLPYLRTYMGHDRIDETAYYIHILPENLVTSSAIDWNAFNSMFPEVMEQ